MNYITTIEGTGWRGDGENGKMWVMAEQPQSAAPLSPLCPPWWSDTSATSRVNQTRSSWKPEPVDCRCSTTKGKKRLIRVIVPILSIPILRLIDFGFHSFLVPICYKPLGEEKKKIYIERQKLTLISGRNSQGISYDFLVFHISTCQHNMILSIFIVCNSFCCWVEVTCRMKTLCVVVCTNRIGSKRPLCLYS